jgi:hypothetical protein
MTTGKMLHPDMPVLVTVDRRIAPPITAVDRCSPRVDSPGSPISFRSPPTAPGVLHTALHRDVCQGMMGEDAVAQHMLRVEDAVGSTAYGHGPAIVAGRVAYTLEEFCYAPHQS